MIYIIYCAIFLEIFISEAAGLELSSVPQIYPQKSHVVVDAHTDLVLGCRGAEPLRWTFYDDVNGRHYNTSQKNITYRNNSIELEYKFETILTIYNVSHVNVGFYYCHGEKPHFNTPRRSNRIYVFVHDDNNLSVITSEEYRVIGYVWIMTIPCRPTSPDINITLNCNNLSISVTPVNYYSELKNTGVYRVRFDPYDGFEVRRINSNLHFCRCSFERQNERFSFYNELAFYDGVARPAAHIEGSDSVNVGDNLTLQCSLIEDLYYPYYGHGLQWEAPIIGHYAETNLYTLKFKHNVLLISTLTIKNVSIEDEGYYQCKLIYERANRKYVVVHDKQVSPPRIYSPDPGQEEIQVNSGDNITLRCEGSRPITWSWDEVEDEAKPITPEYLMGNLPDVRVNKYLPFHNVGTDFCGPFLQKDRKGTWAAPPEPHIEGPNEDLVFVGDTLQLSCTAAVTYNIPDDALRWTVHNNSSSSNITAERINVAEVKVLISKLFVFNVKAIYEGEYICYNMYNNATASKFISVYGNFDVKLYIENLTYHYAYIGQPLVLRCGANVSHNLDLVWTAINATENHIRSMDIEYILDVRHRKGQISLEIDNVTYENEGNYSCYVSDFKNGITNVTKFVQVKRGKAPAMRSAASDVNNPENVDALINETAKLICPAEGDPTPTITWMNGSIRVQSHGQRIDFSPDNSKLTILRVQKFDAGLYTCIARNLYGEVSHVVHLRVKSDSFIGGMIAGVLCMVIAVTVLAVAFAKFEHKKKRRRRALLEDGFDNFKFGETKQAALSAYDTKWEIPRNKIKLGRNLGSGYFGLVVKATVSNNFDGEPVKTVAIKMLHQNCNNSTALHSLLSELKILAHLGKHANLINLLGACTENIADRGLLVVIEYCEHGSLRNYLLENRTNFVNLIDPETELITDVEDAETRAGSSGAVTTLDLMRWALQVARAMEFLASRKVVHGDLAARNVLLAENYVVKISDFGLSRNLNSSDYYRKRSPCPLPVMWMALESIRDKTFSTWSDVWSFGVVLWELFSLARTPFGELEPDFLFYRKLESGYRLDQPRYSTREIYQVMRECWCAQPQSRPTFPRLVRTLDDLLQDMHTRCQHHYVDVSDECSSLPRIRDRDEHTAAHEWIAFDVLASTETC